MIMSKKDEKEICELVGVDLTNDETYPFNISIEESEVLDLMKYNYKDAYGLHRYGSQAFSGLVTILGVKSIFTQMIYPEKVMNNAVKKFIAKDRPLFGELKNLEERHYPHGEINLSRISHNIVNIKFNDDVMYAVAMFMDTETGKVLKNADLSKYRFSLRGAGSVIDDVVLDNYEIIAIDIIPMEDL